MTLVYRLIPSRFLFLFNLMILLDLCVAPTCLAVDAVAVPGEARFPSAGRHETVVTIPSPGRYALSVESKEGASLQLVDRMEGPGVVSGVPGELNGRIDDFWDRGEVKAVVRGHAKAEGEAILAARRFDELNDPPVTLEPLRRIETVLNDFQQRSYWLRLVETTDVFVEAAGRNLYDLRIWRDGSWLEAFQPVPRTLEPLPGRALRELTLGVRLDAGLYRVTAYGGPNEAWTQDDGSHPLWIRLGLPELPAEWRGAAIVGPTGVERFIVPSRANYFRLELPEASPGAISVADIDWKPRFTSWMSSKNQPVPVQAGLYGSKETNRHTKDFLLGEITKKSRFPEAVVHANNGYLPFRLVTVAAEAGRRYSLQQFEERVYYLVNNPGLHWISTIHSGAPGDELDATALVTDSGGRVLGAATVELSRAKGFRRRANVEDRSTLFVKVLDAGEYRVSVEGMDEVEYLFEPFMVSSPPGYRTPKAKKAGEAWALDPGIHVLRFIAKKPGVGVIYVTPVGVVVPPAEPGGISANLGEHDVPTHSYRVVYSNVRPNVASGLVVRPVPVDLTEPLPIGLAPGQRVELTAYAPEECVLTATAEDSTQFGLKVDDATLPQGGKVAQGKHALSVENTGTRPLWASVAFTPTRLLEKSIPPPMEKNFLAALPVFPDISEGSPQYFDLERGRSKAFAVKVEKDGLYRLETTGLLNTEGTLRSRVKTSLASSSGGGTGRNFLMPVYLRTGDYQALAGVSGQSQGHMGLTLSSTALREGGPLKDSIPARFRLEGGKAVSFTFRVSEESTWRIKVFGRGRTYQMRLEDDSGWPVIAPGSQADQELWLEPGTYRVFVLPEPVDTQGIALVEMVTESAKFTGHGPHALSLSARVEHEWREPAKGNQRIPDGWEFVLPAPCEVTATLTGGMLGDLMLLEGGEAKRVAVVPEPGVGKESWRGWLKAGRYRLEASSRRVNDRNPYAVEIAPAALLVGQRRAVPSPSLIAVAVAERRMVEIASLGDVDVRAKLYKDGTLVAESDDTPSDWNFSINALLEPGEYLLAVEGVGSGGTGSHPPAGQRRAGRGKAKPSIAPGNESWVKPVTVTLSARMEKQRDPVVLPARMKFTPGAAAHLISLPEFKTPGFLRVFARSGETVGVAVETKRDGTWRTVAASEGREAEAGVSLPLPESRLRVWSVELRDAELELAVAALDIPAVSEKALGEGIPLTATEGFPGGVARIALERPGTFRFADSALRFSPDSGAAAAKADNDLAGAVGMLWLTSTAQKARGERLFVARERVLVSPGAVVDFAKEEGETVVALASAPGATPVLSPPKGRAHGVAEDGSAAVILPGREPLLRVSLADGGGRAPVALSSFVYRAGRKESIGLETRAGRLDPGSSLKLSMPEGIKRVRLSTTPGVIGAVEMEGYVTGVLGAASAARVETFATSATVLELFSVSDAASHYEVEISAADSIWVVSPDKPFERPMTGSGTVRLSVKGGARGVRAVGAAGPITFLGNDGVVIVGDSVDPVGVEGVAIVPCKPGPLAVWTTESQAGEPMLWDGRGAEPVELRLPAVKKLGGATSAFTFILDEENLLRIVVPTGGVIRLSSGWGESEWIRPEGGVVYTPVPKGRATVALRGLAGLALGGSVEIDALPVQSIGEGVAPETLLAPGASVAYRFEAGVDGPVGIGVRAGSAEVAATLYGPDGKLVGSGVNLMPELKKGVHTLVISQPPDAGPTLAAPALAGVARPPLGPPPEVIRNYIGEDER